VASDGALERTRVLDELTGLAVQHFSGFEPNPRLTQARDAAALVERHRFDAVVGVGGASTLDVAKLARILPSAEPAAFAALAGDATVLRDAAPLLVLVPTTAGPGAEVTSFAAVYVDGSKHSLDHPRVRADAALVDSDLIHRSPTELLATCALDGLAQSIESVLSLRSTEGSRRLAFEAMPAFLELLPQVDEAPPKALRDASRAGVAVGRAIDVSRTTAGHAFAYPTTVRHGVPHGLACALHLTWILPYFATNVNSRCQDPRGASFVHARLGELAAAAGAGGEEEFGRRVAELIELAGASSRLSDHGIGTADTEALVRDALGSARAANSPVPIDPDDAIQLLRVSG
jgi:alcohol dehydrogenase class IV